MLQVIEGSSDAFGYLTRLFREQPQTFGAIANELLASSSKNPGLWRYLTLYFIRIQRYEAAALASENHLFAEPASNEAFLRRFRVALLAGDAVTAQRLLSDQRDRCGEFQYACSRFLYICRFNHGIFPFDTEMHKLREVASLEMSRALLREIRVGASPTVESTQFQADMQSSRNPILNVQDFSRAMAGLDHHSNIVLLGNGGSLRGSNRGLFVDSSNFVVRINFPRIQEMSEHVGTRTDLVFFTEAFLHSQENIRSLNILRETYPGVPGVAVDAVRTGLIENDVRNVIGVSGICLMPIEIRSLIRALTYDFATTGLCAVATLGMLFQARLYTYGFDFFTANTPIHFFSDTPTDVFIGHETAFEKFVMAAITGNSYP